MGSPLSPLSEDTKLHVLDFLPLPDILHYSETAKQSLVEVLPNLKERRSKQFGDRHAYQLCDPSRLISVHEISSLKDKKLVGCESEHWQVLPSVAERLEGLYRAIPQSHAGKDLARELWLDAKQLNDEEITGDASFSASIQQLHSLLKAHRLHNLLLSKSTINCRPPPADPSIAIYNDLTMTVTLDQYMGDVLLANYLMAHAIAGLVEGPTTYEKWIQHLTRQQDEEATPLDGYQYWIFLHSTILRTLPMKPEWLQQMRLQPICGVQGKAGADYISPPYPFLAPETTNNALKVLAGPLQRRQGNHHLWAHSTRLDDFGPLGPAFRGRDRVRTVVMNPGSLLRHLGMFHAFYGMGVALPPATTTLYSVWFQESQTETSWMVNLSKDCYRNRPMTVQPPQITISPRWD